MAIYNNSRFAGSYTYQDDNNRDIVFLDPIREAQFKPETDDLLIQFEDGMRLDILAKELYGDEQLEWVILDANPQYLSPFDIKSGDLLYVPLPEKVMNRE